MSFVSRSLLAGPVTTTRLFCIVVESSLDWEAACEKQKQQMYSSIFMHGATETTNKLNKIFVN